MCSHTGQRRTKLLQVLISPSIIKVTLKSRTTRCWLAPAGCTFTNSPSTRRGAISPSSLSYTAVRAIMRDMSWFSFHVASVPFLSFYVKHCSFMSYLSQGHSAPGKRQLFGGHRVVSWADADPVWMAVHQADSYQQECHWFGRPGHHRLHSMYK